MLVIQIYRHTGTNRGPWKSIHHQWHVALMVWECEAVLWTHYEQAVWAFLKPHHSQGVKQNWSTCILLEYSSAKHDHTRDNLWLAHTNTHTLSNNTQGSDHLMCNRPVNTVLNTISLSVIFPSHSAFPPKRSLLARSPKDVSAVRADASKCQVL